MNFEVNGRHYNKGYYLADGIYPRWSIFVKTISNAVPGGKKSHFAKVREACRKDVERVFGVRQSRFAVVRYPAQIWSKDQIWEIMTCCVILHNVIIEREQEEPVFETEPYYRQTLLAQIDHQLLTTWTAFLNTRQEIRDPQVHQQLPQDLVEHLWRLKGNT